MAPISKSQFVVGQFQLASTTTTTEGVRVSLSMRVRKSSDERKEKKKEMEKEELQKRIVQQKVLIQRLLELRLGPCGLPKNMKTGFLDLEADRLVGQKVESKCECRIYHDDTDETKSYNSWKKQPDQNIHHIGQEKEETVSHLKKGQTATVTKVLDNGLIEIRIQKQSIESEDSKDGQSESEQSEYEIVAVNADTFHDNFALVMRGPRPTIVTTLEPTVMAGTIHALNNGDITINFADQTNRWQVIDTAGQTWQPTETHVSDQEQQEEQEEEHESDDVQSTDSDDSIDPQY